MTCPDCGYMMTAFDKQCPRCENIGRPQKSCLKCGTSSGIREVLCGRCGHRFSDPVEVPAAEKVVQTNGPHYANISPIDRDEIKSIVQEVVSAQPPMIPDSFMPLPHPGRIVAMWLITIVAWFAFIGGGAGFGFLLDVIAIIIAITLVASASATDKGNGWVKLTLEGIAFTIAFVNASSAGHQY